MTTVRKNLISIVALAEAARRRTLKSARKFLEEEYECLIRSACRPGERPNNNLSNVDWANRSLVRRYQRMLAKIDDALK